MSLPPGYLPNWSAPECNSPAYTEETGGVQPLGVTVGKAAQGKTDNNPAGQIVAVPVMGIKPDLLAKMAGPQFNH